VVLRDRQPEGGPKAREAVVRVFLVVVECQHEVGAVFESDGVDLRGRTSHGR
jgi:hypothetical protein